VLAAALPVGTVDFEDRDAVALQVPRQAGAPGAGPLDADSVDDPEPSEPVEELGVAGRGGRERCDAELGASLVESSGDVDVLVGVDAADDDGRRDERGAHGCSPPGCCRVMGCPVAKPWRTGHTTASAARSQ
jgi:hypothetical protein